jgi:hypothetical protein
MTSTPPLKPKTDRMALDPTLDAALIGETIQMALSDHVSFSNIRDVHRFGPDRVKALMRSNLGGFKSEVQHPGLQ